MRHKLGIGREVPWLRAEASAALLDFRGDLRDSNLYAFSLQSGKRLHERADAILAYSYEYRDGYASPSTFDHHSHTGSIDLNFLLTENTLLGLEYSLCDGDIEATCSEPSCMRIWDVARARQPDNAYGTGWWVYRIEATTHAYGINLSYAFGGGHYTLNFGYNREYGNAPRFNYSNDIFWTSLNYSF